MKKVLLLMGLVLLFPTLAISAPTSAETKTVLDHYWNGDTPVLADYKVCSEIVREGDEKNNCAGEVNPEMLQAGEKVYLWMNYMVPQDTEQNISILVTRNTRPEKTKNIKITASLRYRTWTILPTNKSGEYKVKIDRELNDNFTTLEKFTYKVAE